MLCPGLSNMVLPHVAQIISKNPLDVASGSTRQEKKDIIEGIANTIRLTNPKTGMRMSEIGGHPIIQALKTKHAASRLAEMRRQNVCSVEVCSATKQI